MNHCPACGSEVSGESRFCGSCGSSLSASEVPTRTSSPSALPTELASVSSSTGPSSAADESRFFPGTVLGKRYRILGLLGRGGMGEVYRADDLKLGQQVALKFLPEDVERDEERLERFLNEARMSLKVTHANVTRVYDIGEVDAQHYISMEYIDGEDLSSLLRRIGRLPKNKAVQVSRQLCAGLAAAHDQGVLHRDLKPANVMLDGRGQVKITDFGLAGLAATIEGAEARAGTPAYMSPEQWAGDELTVQSDLYSLGLVLYELFTGESVFLGKSPAEIQKIREQDNSSVTSPSTVIEGFDPAVERVILQCLEPRAPQRPQSALAVSAALPGGDPLAAALAAGDTPSPEMVAQAGEDGGVQSWVAWSLLGAIVVGLVMWPFLARQSLLVNYMDPESRSPEVLADRAVQIVESLGYDEAPVDRVSAILPRQEYFSYIASQDQSPDRWQVLRQSQPTSFGFWYRQSPVPLEKQRLGDANNWMDDPAMDVPGMLRLELDLQGRLVSLQAMPDQVEEAVSDVEVDWSSLLVAAGLDETALTLSPPKWEPPVFADSRVAWSGTYPDSPAVPIRVEAAALAGRPVAFGVFSSWSEPRLRAAVEDPQDSSAQNQIGVLVMVLLLGGTARIAWRNYRSGRGDVRTALSVALALAVVRMIYLVGDHRFSIGAGLQGLIGHLVYAIFAFCFLWVFYMALEPLARRFWPQMLTSWVRLFNGRARDPLVGRDLLIGVLAGLLFPYLSWLVFWGLPQLLGVAPMLPSWWDGTGLALMGGRHLVGAAAAALGKASPELFLPVMMVALMRLLLRKTWLALGLLLPIMLLLFLPAEGSPVPHLIVMPLFIGLFFLVLFRVGFLASAASMCTFSLVQDMPITPDPSSWFFSSTVFTLALVAALALYGFKIALPGRTVVRNTS